MDNTHYDDMPPIVSAILDKQAEVEKHQTRQIEHLQKCFEEVSRDMKQNCLAVARMEVKIEKISEVEVKLERLSESLSDLTTALGKTKTAMDIKTGVFSLIGGAIPASIILAWMLLKA